MIGPRFQDLDIWLSGPGFQDLNARFQDLDFKTWVSGPQREVSGPGSQDQGFRISKALHPTVVLFFSRHFSLRPVVTDGQTHGLSDLWTRHLRSHTQSLSLSLSQSNLSLVRSLPGSSGISRALAAWFSNPIVQAESRFLNPTVRADSAGRLKRRTIVSRTDRLCEFIYKIGFTNFLSTQCANWV
jgi:hypothetical protein